MQGSNKPNAGSSCSDKAPIVNWPHHADAIQSSRSKDDFLSSSFLFSLPTQRANPEPDIMLSLRSAACKIQGPERLQVPWIEKAWRSVRNTQVACKSYLRPGLSAKVKDCDGDYAHAYAKDSSYNANKLDNVPRSTVPSQESMHQRPEGGILEQNTSHRLAGINSRTATYQSNHVVGTTYQCNFTRTDAKSYQTVPVADNMCADPMDDDEILASIDVDRIVMEHYEATNTPRGSASRQMSTPSGNKCNSTGLDENSLAQELSEICSHGCKLAFCPEPNYHLLELKDQLLAVSSELIDGSGELSPQRSEELRQQRAHLKKQMQILGDYMARPTQDDERQRSHSMASTTAVEGHHPPMTPRSTFVMDNDRFQSQLNFGNEPGNGGSCYTPAPYTYTDSFDTPSVLRDYTRKNIDITYTDGSGDKKWSSRDFSWTKELEVHNKKVFGNRSFRPNQREIINATMSRRDVFVLMPTGGGKSLTYQLPAFIEEGITLVVCPLVSLIQDQIMHLLQANIPATYLSANLEWTEQQRILRDLLSTCNYKLLYVTPEKIAKSDALLRQLEILYSRGHLSRIVIDEAHCVSQWGHDFRPDYQNLGLLKQKFPETPVLALTATATASVKEDVVQALGLANCIVFRQSFNRSNLRYIVMPKTKKCFEDIDCFIRKNHHKECGIIYCLSRMDCEKVAEQLREYGHQASHYHGSMEPFDRAEVQRLWSKDKINIICATVAFGMGINKPDVRFVIHHSLPKSIEGYHQECGRAGRDGQPSSCVLYYNYSDYIRVKHMITQGSAEQVTSRPPGRSLSKHEQALQTHKENLLCMVSYCENDVDCRRFLQLIHFGETFDPSHCAKTCDNCLKGLRWIEKDVTDIARQLVELVSSIRQACSSSHILEVYRGSMNQNVKKSNHDALPLHGAGKNLGKGEAARVLRHLVTEGILTEDVKKSDYGSVSSVLKVNHTKAGGLRSGNHIIVLKFPTPEQAPKMGKLDEPSISQTNKTVHQQSEVDENFSTLLFETLKILRTQIAEDTPGCVGYHIFKNETLKEISIRIPRTKEELLDINGIGKVKLNKYGDRVLATIDELLNQFSSGGKRNSSSGGSNEQNEAAKKRRGLTAINVSDNGDDFEERSVQSKKRTTKTRNAKQVISDAASIVQDGRHIIDLELDGYEEEELCSSVQQPVASGRVLPKWAAAGNTPTTNIFDGYKYTK
ncbi:ATP-dependent DNA helicase Q-like 4A [Lolium perenne]|uniref:ATP-dependent DNA helicase Q-like 4A n=1 Tax=Lolium perenne TaxID=4522 RepID=UPI0021F52448|nr:ATP-dependent DNA helicase Q-like 4A [Lolium perenne]